VPVGGHVADGDVVATGLTSTDGGVAGTQKMGGNTGATTNIQGRGILLNYGAGVRV